jgi:hypothetical protein
MTSGITAFLSDLAATGRVTVARGMGLDPEGGRRPPAGPSGPLPDETERLDGALARLYEQACRELPPGAPPLDREAAAWSAFLLYRACQFLVHRELGEELVEESLSIPCPSRPSPSVCLSVDLTFRHLPDVIALSRGIAREDPLVRRLVALAGQWPLSAVGAGVDPGDPAPFAGDPSLLALYVDRILATGDVARLAHPLVADAARRALGAHPDLASAAARALDAARSTGDAE